MVKQIHDDRKVMLTQWISDLKPNHTVLEVVSGDASSRRYFRFRDQNISYIAVDAPPASEDVALFVAMTEAYAAQKLIVPTVFDFNEEQGFMCLLDLGDDLLSKHLSETNVLDFYRSSMNLLPSVRQVMKTSKGALPSYNRDMLLMEMNLMDEWFLDKLLDIQPIDSKKEMTTNIKDLLVNNALKQPQVGVHRDFHSRNLMLYQDDIAVIDYQGAVCGPLTYDLVSLLRDCYVEWPQSILDILLHEQFQILKDEDILPDNITEPEFIQYFDWMGIQRHMKVLGIFSRLSLRDNKHDYLKEIPRVLNYIIDVSSRYVELQSFSEWLREDILPEWRRVCVAQ